MPTIKQKIATQKMVENGGNVSGAMHAAGYSDKTARTPSKLTNSKGFKKAAQPLITRLKKELDRAVALMQKKISKAKYRDLVDSIDKLHKNIRLLEGASTENVNVRDYSTQSTEELERLAYGGEEGTGKKGTGTAPIP